MMAILMAGASVPRTSLLKTARARATLRRTIYAPIDDHRTATANDDIAAAWIAAGLIGLTLLLVLPL